VIARLSPEFQRVGAETAYREAVNRILAAYGVAWDLGSDGKLHRVLPAAAQAQVVAGLAELAGNAQFAPALDLFN
jgi:hypothetical protein